MLKSIAWFSIFLCYYLDYAQFYSPYAYLMSDIDISYLN